MSDRAIENAKALKINAIAEIERLEAEARVWRDRIMMADQFIDQWNAFASGEVMNPLDSAVTGTSEQNKTEPARIVKRRATKNSTKEDVAAAALEIIREHGKPVSRANLYEALVARGLVIDGSEPEQVLSTMLWRMMNLIVRLKTGGYWERGVIAPEFGYTQEVADELDRQAREVQARRMQRGERIVDPSPSA